LKRFSGLGHLLSQPAQDGRTFRPQKSYKVADNNFFIFAFVNFGGTGGDALLYAVQDTGPKEPPFQVIFADIQLAGSELEDFLQYYQNASQVLCTGERPE